MEIVYHGCYRKADFVLRSQQLTDAHCAFEEEKAAWASQVGQSDAKVQELQQEVSNVTEVLRKVHS